MPPLLFTNARVFDGASPDCAEGVNLLVADGLIREMGVQPIAAPDALVIDVGGRTLMSGLIDTHIHAFASNVVLQRAEALGEAYRTAHAVRMLQHALVLAASPPCATSVAGRRSASNRPVLASPRTICHLCRGDRSAGMSENRFRVISAAPGDSPSKVAARRSGSACK